MAESQGTLPAVPSGAIPREKGTTPAMAPGAEPVVKVEDLLHLLDDDLEAALPSGAILKEEGTVPPMPPGTFVKVGEAVVEEEGSGTAGPRGNGCSDYYVYNSVELALGKLFLLSARASRNLP